MVGLIHRLILDMLQRQYGEQMVNDILSETKAAVGHNIGRHFRLDTNYSDQEFQTLLGIALKKTDLSQSDFEHVFAQHFLADALQRWPVWFQMSDSAKSFLERQPRIHNGFASSMKTQQDRDRINDKFHLDSTDDSLTVHYHSPNQLCGLYVELAKAVIKHYGDEAEVEERLCLKNGDHECCIVINWNNTSVTSDETTNA